MERSPSLYDTSTSTADSPPRYFPRSHPSSSSSPYQQHNSLASAAKAASNRSSSRTESWTSAPVVVTPTTTRHREQEQPDQQHHQQQRPVIAYPESKVYRRAREPEQRVAQSEPGVYGHRLAASKYLRSLRKAEEKKEDSVDNIHEPYPDPEPVVENTDSNRQDDDPLPVFLQRGRDTQRTATTDRSNSRTRDLARRFEPKRAPPEPEETAVQQPVRPQRPTRQSKPGTTMPRASSGTRPVTPVDIETPEPANVKALRQKLWGADESLQVAVRPNWSPELAARHSPHNPRSTFPVAERSTYAVAEQRVDQVEQPPLERQFAEKEGTMESYESQQQPQLVEEEEEEEPPALSTTRASSSRPLEGDGPVSRRESARMAIVNRNSRSLSPSARRPQYAPGSVGSGNSSNNNSKILDNNKSQDNSSNKQQPVFHSKYYAAAQRGLLSSPARSSSTAAARSNASSYQRRYTQSEPGASVENLLARLHSVDRSDPTAALARIDAILQGNDEMEEKKPNEWKQQQQHTEDEEGSLSDDSSVSSITNPTFQGTHTAKPHHHHHHKKATVAQLGGTGKPRPSALGAYGATAASPNKLSPVVEGRRSSRHRQREPPPGTISLSSKERSNSQKNPHTATTPPDETQASPPLQQEQQSPVVLQIDPSNSTELAEKIKRWDELSSPDAVRSTESPPQLETMNGVARADSQVILSPQGSAKETITPTPKSSSLPRRAHPWDSAIPVRMGKIDTRNTSMDSAVGVEAEFTPKYGSAHDAGRQERMERLIRDKNEELRAKQSDSQSDDEITSREARVFLRSPEDESTEDDHHLEGIEEGGHMADAMQRESASALAEDFDSAWVRLPNSTFFPGCTRRVDEEGHPSKRYESPDDPGAPSRSSRNGKGFVTFAPQTEHNRVPSRPLHLRPQEDDASWAYDQGHVGTPVHDEDPSVETGGVEVSLTSPKANALRRGLRGLLGRRNQLSRDTVILDQAPKTSTSRDPPRYNYSLDDHEPDPVRRGRFRRDSAKQRRARSHSLDETRTRNPGIARKFSRLLRVYDHDGDVKVNA